MIKNYIDYWQDVKNATMTTINKTKGKYPETEWKIKLLISEHSPIRKIRINWLWVGLKSWISVHYCRHKIGIDHWISTQRDDRTGIDRDSLRQDSLVNHEMELNAQAAINVSRKRLCYKAHIETRGKWIEFLNDLKEKEPELYAVCVPECVYRCGCPEFESCGMFDKFIEGLWIYRVHDIKYRYEKYKESVQ